MSCVMCESDAVKLRPAVDVLIVPYSVRVARYTARIRIGICTFVGVLLNPYPTNVENRVSS